MWYYAKLFLAAVSFLLEYSVNVMLDIPSYAESIAINLCHFTFNILCHTRSFENSLSLLIFDSSWLRLNHFLKILRSTTEDSYTVWYLAELSIFRVILFHEGKLNVRILAYEQAFWLRIRAKTNAGSEANGEETGGVPRRRDFSFPPLSLSPVPIFISLIRMRSKRDIKMGRLCTPGGAVLGIVGGGVTFRFLNGEAILDENMLFWVRLYALVVVLKILLDFRL